MLRGYKEKEEVDSSGCAKDVAKSLRPEKQALRGSG
jgi:hypothetical protein